MRQCSRRVMCWIGPVALGEGEAGLPAGRGARYIADGTPGGTLPRRAVDQDAGSRGGLPDIDLAVRALAAAGPSWPALQHVGYDQFATAMREALRPLYVEGLGVRIVSEFGWIIAKVPGA